MASVLFYCEPEELSCYNSDTSFLDACSFCQKSLDQNDDVFMYQGITAFCSEECRQRQIETDNPPRRRRRSASWQSGRPVAADGDKSVRTGVIAAA